MKNGTHPNRTTKIWLFILENGRTAAQEVAELLGITTSQAHSHLASMERTGLLRKYPGRNQPGARTLFGVTGACGTPGGIRLADLLRALQPNREPPAGDPSWSMRTISVLPATAPVDDRPHFAPILALDH